MLMRCLQIVDALCSDRVRMRTVAISMLNVLTVGVSVSLYHQERAERAACRCDGASDSAARKQ